MHNMSNHNEIIDNDIDLICQIMPREKNLKKPHLHRLKMKKRYISVKDAQIYVYTTGVPQKNSLVRSPK